jgi:hypothetical protein
MRRHTSRHAGGMASESKRTAGSRTGAPAAGRGTRRRTPAAGWNAWWLRLHRDVVALDVAAPGVAVVGAPDEFDGEAVSRDLLAREP